MSNNAYGAPSAPMPQPSRPPMPQPPRKNRWLLGGIVGLVCGLVLGGCTGALAAGGDGAATAAVQPQPATTVTASATATTTVTAPSKPNATTTVTKTVTAKPKAPTKPEAPAKPKTITIAEGVWHVGEDVPAGRYHTAGPADSAFPMCYWSRNRDASGTKIIANGLLQGPGYVNLKQGEYFETNGCRDWVKK